MNQKEQYVLFIWYNDGFNTGNQDKQISYRSNYAYYMHGNNPLLNAYAQGYRDAQTHGRNENPYRPLTR